MSVSVHPMWADENAPTATLAARVWNVFPPRRVREEFTSLFVRVDDMGFITAIDGFFWGAKIDGHEAEREAFEYLREWEYATLARIGPEDSEWAATKRLDPEYGHDY